MPECVPETESHFLLYFKREIIFLKIGNIYPGFIHSPNPQKRPHLCGAERHAVLAANKYGDCCQRETARH